MITIHASDNVMRLRVLLQSVNEKFSMLRLVAQNNKQSLTHSTPSDTIADAIQEVHHQRDALKAMRHSLKSHLDKLPRSNLAELELECTTVQSSIAELHTAMADAGAELTSSESALLSQREEHLSKKKREMAFQTVLAPVQTLR